MSNTDVMVIGAGTVAGAATGYAVAATKDKKLRKETDAILKQQKDVFLNSHLEENADEIRKMKKSEFKKLYSKWRSDFKEVADEAFKDLSKKVKNMKLKYSAIAALTGLALGTVATLLTKKD